MKGPRGGDRRRERGNCRGSGLRGVEGSTLKEKGDD